VSAEMPTFNGRLNSLASEPAALADLQGTLALDGPLFRAVFFEPDRLLVLLAHHLIVDVVSWNILVDDLQAALKGPLDDERVPYFTWVEDLTAEAPPALWTKPFPATELPTHIGTEGDLQIWTATLDAERTTALLTSANEPYATHTDEILLAALALGLQQTAGLPVGLEHHGREGEHDLSRTVGWFTSSYPVVLHALASPADTLMGVKETLRSIPRNGRDYGVLRYLQGTELVDVYTAPLSFTYLGQSRPGRAFFKSGPSMEGSARAAVNARLHPLDVLASVEDGQLRVHWLFAGTPEARVAALGQAVHDALIALLDMLSGSAGAFTPSDFPELDMGQGDLDDVLSGQ
jgi:non-ribosomal peptide synthase protein (TIGR01720 family)